MSEIIASTYEIIKEIGSGGGGVVYLANHLRLEKKVVLKADKRKISTREDLLRREVDVLKELKHRYIPQVYDYFIEGNTVYTVIDYIDGESLDKILERGERFPQKQVIQWARQILQALAYLHSPVHGQPPRGFVHSDVKPANIMLRKSGDICLIDFNIALALGEENAVGCSKGYASPEHYGLDFSSGCQSLSGRNEKEDSGTELLFGSPSHRKRQLSISSSAGYAGNSSSGTSGRKKVIPDARSDIYSLGATMYHLLCGKRPPRDAKDVIPLSKKEFSPQIIEIVTKAMEPNPDLRFQTANEMLEALLNLHQNDIRWIRWRRRNAAVITSMLVLAVLGAGAAFIGLKRIQMSDRWLRLTEDARTALDDGNVYDAISDMMELYSEQTQFLAPSPPAKAQEVLTEVLGLYNLADCFKRYKTVELPSAPLDMEMAPDAGTISCICSGELHVIDVENAEITLSLPAEASALAEVEYLTDDILIYAGEQGISAYHLEEQKELWRGEKATGISVSEDKSTVAAIYKDDSFATIYDADTGENKARIEFDGRKQSVAVNDVFINPSDNLFCLNSAGNLLAVSFSDGALEVFRTEEDQTAGNLQIFDSSVGYSHFEGGFFQEYLAFSATTENIEESVFAVMDTNTAEQAGGFGSEGYYFSNTDEQGISVGIDNILVRLEPVSGEQTPLVDTSERIAQYDYDGSFTMTATEDGAVLIFDGQGREISRFERKSICDLLEVRNGTAVIGSSDSPELWIVKYEDHQEKEVAVYDASYQHDEARISSDGKAMTYFSYDRIRVCDLDGNVIKDVDIPDAENVYDQQYVRDEDGSVLKVIYNDGNVDFYSGNTGELVEHTQESPPDASLYEEFETSTLRIESPLHGAPVAYDKNTGKKISELNDEGYLTYVTEVGPYFITQYVTTDDHYYGYLMDQKCQILAYLPYLCDVLGNTVLFDYPTGSIREEKIFELNELQKMARERLEGGKENEN